VVQVASGKCTKVVPFESKMIRAPHQKTFPRNSLEPTDTPRKIPNTTTLSQDPIDTFQTLPDTHQPPQTLPRHDKYVELTKADSQIGNQLWLAPKSF
jgi:hypothetical protein